MILFYIYKVHDVLYQPKREIVKKTSTYCTPTAHYNVMRKLNS